MTVSHRNILCLGIFVSTLLAACSGTQKISRSAQEDVLSNKALTTAHVGISIYDPASDKYLYNYQGDKYFVPASNTKLPTCYAAMKYLGDSLVGLKYGYSKVNDNNNQILAIQPTGDPTLLHPDFKNQPVWDFLSDNASKYKDKTGILDTIWKEKRWGSGWGWSDYDESYMAERSVMPVYGNVIDVKLRNVEDRKKVEDSTGERLYIFKTQNEVFDLMVNPKTYMVSPTVLTVERPMIQLRRNISDNVFEIDDSRNGFSNVSIPFVANNPDGPWPYNIQSSLTLHLIYSTFKYRIGSMTKHNDTAYVYMCPDCMARRVIIKNWHKIYSQPTDSLLKPMMHNSDNFFAEQSLLMVSNELLGVMNDEKIIDTLLKTDFKDLPQKPRWADGSGLSRYNLFTPQDFVTILNKMKNDFGMDRIKVILATGGEGTIRNYYKADSGYIYGKTGTLSGVVAFSGFLYTKKGKLLIFSTLVNNHTGSATDVRRAVEKFLEGVRNNF